MADGTAADGHARVQNAYDRLAEGYDREVGGTLGAAHAKGLAARHLQRAFRPGDVVLDVGCGTGVDACQLAARGVQVVALDISAAMLERTQARARERGLSGMVQTAHLPAAEVGAIQGHAPGTLAGAYSLFGALNLEEDLEGFREGLHALLRPGAVLYAGLVNPNVLWEWTLYPLLMRWDKPLRKRRRRPTMRVSRARDDRVPVHFYTPEAFARIMAPRFALESVVGANILVPPPYLDKYMRHVPGFVSRMSRWEARLAGRPPWNRWGYFSFLTLRRIP
ncbi:MAG: class I SAM-dependent DNA methyltransferase [Thermoplasmatota archaeon]